MTDTKTKGELAKEITELKAILAAIKKRLAEIKKLLK